MKSSDLQIGKDYAVIPAWQYSSAHKKNVEKVREGDVIRATLVSLQKYEYKVYRSENKDDNEFAKANTGSRNIGYLVATTEFANQGNPVVYWLARPQDIVALYSTLEPRWAQEKKEEEERKQRELLEAKKREEERKLAEQNRLRYENATRDSLREILGANRVGENSIIFNTRYGGSSIEISKDLFDILIEKVLEAKDLVG